MVSTDNSLSSPALPRWTKIAFGVGAVGETVYMGMFNTFIALYYNQAIGLSNSLIGTAILLAMIGDAISDPAVGIVSDRWRSKYGRRHPFLLFAPIPLALSLWFIFNPPEALIADDFLATSAGQWALFAWLAGLTIVSRFFLTLYVIPHLSLGGELVRTQKERSQLFSINAVFGYISGALFIFLAWSVFLSGETVGSDGVAVSNHLKAASYGPLSMFAAAIILITISLCAVGTLSRVPYLSAPPQQLERMSVLLLLKKIISTLENRNYRFLLLGFFFFMISAGLLETFNIYVNTYFWELKPTDIRWISLSAVPGLAIGAIFTPRLMQRYDRRPVLCAAIMGLVIFTQLMVDLRLLGLLPENGSEELLYLLVANAFVLFLCLGVTGVAVPSMLGDVIDENELVTGLREEGLFYSARAFFAKFSNSLAHFVAGIILDVFVRLPFEAVPGQVDEAVVFRLGLAAGPIMAIGALISIVFYLQYNLSASRHAEILKELGEKEATPS